MNLLEVWGELQLLTDRGLGDTEGLGDLLLAHTGGGQCTQDENAPQPRDLLTAPGVPVLCQ